MINTWGELWAAIKQWLVTPLKWERKIKVEVKKDISDLLKPTKIFVDSDEWNQLQRANLKKISDLYFQHLRDRLRAGETLNAEELDRYQRYYNDPTRSRFSDGND